MLKYLLFIILGIIIFILLNNVNRFSIGVSYETETTQFFTPQLYPVRKPQRVTYIKWEKSEIDSIETDMQNLSTDKLLPIFLGIFKKDSEYPFRPKVTRHFYIIDKKIYYFEELTEWELVRTGYDRTYLKPKNYGNREREPIVLIDVGVIEGRLVEGRRKARTAVTDNSMLGLMLNSYLKVTGIDGREIKMYDDNVDNLRLAEKIIQEYNSLIRKGIRQSANISCSVNIDRIYGEIFMDPDTDKLQETLKALPNDIPEYSIDLSKHNSRLCNSWTSVIQLDLSEVRFIDYSNGKFILDYKGVRLLENEVLYRGKYGLVVVVSNIPYTEFNKVSEGGNLAIALTLKLYVEDGQDDPEITLIESLNRQEIEFELKDCQGEGDLVGARIINTMRGIGKVAIMTIMDGDMSRMIRNINYNASNTSPSERTLPFKIIRRICKILLCIKRAGYSYTDLKLQNILYKCYNSGELLITMGDLGGISEYSDDFGGLVWTNIPPFNERGFDTNNAVVWIFGLVIIQLYGIISWDSNDSEEIRTSKLAILNPREVWYEGPFVKGNSGGTGYFDHVPAAVETLMGEFDTPRIKTATNDKEIEFIKGLLGRIFVRARQRITLQGIHDLLEGYEG